MINGIPPGPAIRASLGIAIVFILIGVSVWILLPFIGAIVWAGIIAISLYPVHLRLTARLGGHRKLSASIIGLIVAMVLFVPLTFLFLTIGENAEHVANAIPSMKELAVLPQPAWLGDTPLIGARLSKLWSNAQADMAGAIEAIRPQLRDTILWLASRIVASSVTVLEAILATIFASIFLVTAPKLKEFFERLSAKCGTDENSMHAALVVHTVRGVSRGVIGTAFIQALLLGLGYALAGAPFPLLLAFLALILCSIQLGTLLVGLPVAVWMWSQGDTGTAIFILIWTIVVNGADNFIKPILMGRDFPVPIWVGLIGVIGGLFAMGLIGLFIGPVALAVSYRLLVHWTNE